MEPGSGIAKRLSVVLTPSAIINHRGRQMEDGGGGGFGGWADLNNSVAARCTYQSVQQAAEDAESKTHVHITLIDK